MSAALANLIDRSRREREDWRYTDVEKLLKKMPSDADGINPFSLPTDFPSIIPDAVQRRQIVFINGVWQKDKTQLGNLPASILQGDAASGYRLTLAAQSCLVAEPIDIVFVSQGTGEIAMKLAIDVGANASLAITEHYCAEGGTTSLVETDIHLGKQAKLVNGKIMHGAGAVHFARANVRIEEGGYYRNFSLVKDMKLIRNEIHVALEGPLSQCNLYGAMLLRGQEHADMLTRVTHAAPHGTSRQFYKTVVKDRARGVFQGRVTVAEGAQKTDAQQLCRVLLLSDQAEMDAKPELEIYADDVACSHGCAVGDLDADAMFYLRSRGLSEGEARALLLRSFIGEVMETIQFDAARTYIRSLVERWMDEKV